MPILSCSFVCLNATHTLLSPLQYTEKHNQVLIGWFLVGICIVTFALSGSKSNPFEMINDGSTDEEALERVIIEKRMQGSLQGRYFNRSFGAYWYKRYDDAVKWSEEYLKLASLCGFLDVYNSLYRGLAAFQLARSSDDAKNGLK